MESQTGYVTIEGHEKAANLSMVEGRLNLQVTDSEGTFNLQSPSDIERLTFRGTHNYFTLLALQHRSTQTRLGVGGLTNYAVHLALEGVTYESDEEISGKTWLLYLEDFAKILHVTGLQHDITFDYSGGIAWSWFFKQAAPIILDCPKAKLNLRVGQDMKTGGDAIAGPSLNFRYPIVLVLEEEQQLHSALKTLSRISSFFSLMMGRVLSIEEVALSLEDGTSRHDAKVHGLVGIQRSDKPKERLVAFAGTEALASMLDEWLLRYDEIEEAIGLHLSGLERRNLPWQLRFQIFIQALEAFHRRTASASGTAIDVEAVSNALRDQNIPEAAIERVSGILAHAHEPSLTHRLKSYWDQFSTEINALRPTIQKNLFIDRVVATRNHFAHRTDVNSKVLKGRELWDYTETIKAISHMALLNEIGGNVTGLGKAMLEKRFAEYVLLSDAK